MHVLWDILSIHYHTGDDVKWLTLWQLTLKWKCLHFDEICITGYTGSCQYDNFQCTQWWKFRQIGDTSISENLELAEILRYHPHSIGIHDVEVKNILLIQVASEATLNKSNLRDLIAATGQVILNWIQIVNFSARVTVKFVGWPRKTIGHFFYTTSSFVQHFIAIGEFKLELQSGNAQCGSNSMIFRAVWPWNLTDDLEKQ